MDSVELGGQNSTSTDWMTCQRLSSAPCQGEGRGFESRRPLQGKLEGIGDKGVLKRPAKSTIRKVQPLQLNQTLAGCSLDWWVVMPTTSGAVLTLARTARLPHDE